MKIIIKGNEDAELCRVLCYQQGDTGILFSIAMMFRYCYDITYACESSGDGEEDIHSLHIWKTTDAKKVKLLAQIILVPETAREKKIINWRPNKSRAMRKYQEVDKETFYIFYSINDFGDCQVLYEDLPGIKYKMMTAKEVS